MSAFTRRLRYFYLAYLARPAHDRALVRLVKRRKFCHIVELGLGTTQRAVRLIETAQAASPEAKVRYTGIDLFEMRPADAACSISLKDCYRRLRETGAVVQLVPGDPYAALARVANSLTQTDLVLISADQQGESLGRAWFYLPRMLPAGSLVFQEELGPKPTWREVPQAEVQRLAAPTTVRRAA